MANRRCVTVALSPELLDFAAALIASGRYGSVSEVVRTAMRDLEERELAFREHRSARGTRRRRPQHEERRQHPCRGRIGP